MTRNNIPENVEMSNVVTTFHTMLLWACNEEKSPPTETFDKIGRVITCSFDHRAQNRALRETITDFIQEKIGIVTPSGNETVLPIILLRAENIKNLGKNTEEILPYEMLTHYTSLTLLIKDADPSNIYALYSDSSNPSRNGYDTLPRSVIDIVRNSTLRTFVQERFFSKKQAANQCAQYAMVNSINSFTSLCYETFYPTSLLMKGINQIIQNHETAAEAIKDIADNYGIMGKPHIAAKIFPLLLRWGLNAEELQQREASDTISKVIGYSPHATWSDTALERIVRNFADENSRLGIKLPNSQVRIFPILLFEVGSSEESMHYTSMVLAITPQDRSRLSVAYSDPRNPTEDKFAKIPDVISETLMKVFSDKITQIECQSTRHMGNQCAQYAMVDAMNFIKEEYDGTSYEVEPLVFHISRWANLQYFSDMILVGPSAPIRQGSVRILYAEEAPQPTERRTESSAAVSSPKRRAVSGPSIPIELQNTFERHGFSQKNISAIFKELGNSLPIAIEHMTHRSRGQDQEESDFFEMVKEMKALGLAPENISSILGGTRSKLGEIIKAITHRSEDQEESDFSKMVKEMIASGLAPENISSILCRPRGSFGEIIKAITHRSEDQEESDFSKMVKEMIASGLASENISSILCRAGNHISEAIGAMTHRSRGQGQEASDFSKVVKEMTALGFAPQSISSVLWGEKCRLGKIIEAMTHPDFILSVKTFCNQNPRKQYNLSNVLGIPTRGTGKISLKSVTDLNRPDFILSQIEILQKNYPPSIQAPPEPSSPTTVQESLSNSTNHLDRSQALVTNEGRNGAVTGGVSRTISAPSTSTHPASSTTSTHSALSNRLSHKSLRSERN